MALAPPTPPRKLPVWPTVVACYSAVASNLGQLVRISWLWLLIMAPVYAAAHWLAWPWTTKGGHSAGLASELVELLPYLVELPFLASIAVAWHRLVLRRETSEGLAYLRLDRSVWHYAALSFVLFAIVQVPMSVMSVALQSGGGDVFLTPLLSLIGLLAIVLMAPFFLLPRLSLTLPAAALGADLTFSEAWRITRGNTLRLAGASAVCMLPMLLPLLAFLSAADATTRSAYALSELALSTAYAVLVIFYVTLLSLAYRHFLASDDGSARSSA